MAGALAFGDDSHKLSAHPASFALGSDVGKGNLGSAQEALGACAAHSAVPRNAVWTADLEPDPLADGDWVDVTLLALLLAQPERADQGHGATAGGVGAGDGAGPYPCDDRRQGVVGQLGLRVEVANAPFGFVADPVPVTADVLCETCRAWPGAC